MYRLTLGLFAAAALAALTASGCASMNVRSYAEPGIDFTEYYSYKWESSDLETTGDPRLDANPFFGDRVRADVDEQLVTWGFTKTDGPAHLLLHYHISLTQKLNMNGTDRSRESCTDCRPFVYDAGTLVLDLVDARTNTVVWRGWAEGSFDGLIDNQDVMEETIDATVTRILEKFPGRL
jgi:hypothetical protein